MRPPGRSLCFCLGTVGPPGMGHPYGVTPGLRLGVAVCRAGRAQATGDRDSGVNPAATVSEAAASPPHTEGSAHLADCWEGHVRSRTCLERGGHAVRVAVVTPKWVTAGSTAVVTGLQPRSVTAY